MPTDKLTPAELAEGLRRMKCYRGLLVNRQFHSETEAWCIQHGETALRELAALRAYRESILEATLGYDDPRRASQPPQASWGLELFHDIEEADLVFREATKSAPPAESRDQ